MVVEVEATYHPHTSHAIGRSSYRRQTASVWVNTPTWRAGWLAGLTDDYLGTSITGLSRDHARARSGRVRPLSLSLSLSVSALHKAAKACMCKRPHVRLRLSVDRGSTIHRRCTALNLGLGIDR